MKHEIRIARLTSVLGLLMLGGCSGASPPVAGLDEAEKDAPDAPQDAEVASTQDSDTGPHVSETPTNLPGTASTGTLPRKVIRRVVGERMGDIISCYERYALAEGGDLQGVVEVKFIVGVSGAVTMASISSTTLKHEPTEKCITDVIRALVFPSPDGGVAVVTYPFELTFSEE